MSNGITSLETNFKNWYKEKQPWFEKIEKIDKEFVLYQGRINSHDQRIKRLEEEVSKYGAILKKYKDYEH